MFIDSTFDMIEDKLSLTTVMYDIKSIGVPFSYT